MKELNDLIGLSEDYHVKGYLTWSSSHNINPPSITHLNVNEENLPHTDIGCPHKICFFSLEENFNYYLLLWYMSDNASVKTLSDGKLCQIPTNFLSIFPGNTIHGGGFRTLNSSSNFRVQPVITSRLDTQTYCLRQRIFDFEYTNISDNFLNRFKFDAKIDTPHSVSKNNFNENTCQSKTSRSIERKHFKPQIQKCLRISSLQKVSFSSRPTHSFEDKIIIPQNSENKRTPPVQSASFSSRIKNSYNKFSNGFNTDVNIKHQQYYPTHRNLEEDCGAWNQHLPNQNKNLM